MASIGTEERETIEAPAPPDVPVPLTLPSEPVTAPEPEKVPA